MVVGRILNLPEPGDQPRHPGKAQASIRENVSRRIATGTTPGVAMATAAGRDEDIRGALSTVGCRIYTGLERLERQTREVTN